MHDRSLMNLRSPVNLVSLRNRLNLMNPMNPINLLKLVKIASLANLVSLMRVTKLMNIRNLVNLASVANRGIQESLVRPVSPEILESQETLGNQESQEILGSPVSQESPVSLANRVADMVVNARDTAKHQARCCISLERVLTF